MLDLDHELYGIPLFIVDPERLGKDEISNFAIGIGRDGKVRSCYEFISDRGTVSGQPIKRGNQLKDIFFKMLNEPTLKTVGEYLGNVMVRNPEKSKEFAIEYNSLRQPSDQIRDFIQKHIDPNGDKVGLDVGCGPGNYTFPFCDKFKKTIGIDLNDKLLEIAIKKAAEYKNNNLEFIKADAVKTPFESGSIDAIWSVSTMHYLRGKKQWYFFKECHRILKQDGILVIDIGEFLEQHPSLWLREYFPFLKERYKDCLFSSITYKDWLGEIGFNHIECIPIEYNVGEKDNFIRAVSAIQTCIYPISSSWLTQLFRKSRIQKS